MNLMHRTVLLALLLSMRFANASVLTPISDDEVVEKLPAVSGDQAGERALLRELKKDPRSEPAGVALARIYLDQARSLGVPRRAGRALAILQPWSDPREAPDEVVLLTATVQQFLHQFDASGANLELLVKRRPTHAQAWLTLATVRRVQGRYADSARACDGLAGTTARMHALACRAENDSLQGMYPRARDVLVELLAAPRLTASDRNWLLTSVAAYQGRNKRSQDSPPRCRARPVRLTSLFCF